MTAAGLLVASIVGGLLFLLPYLGIEPPGGSIPATVALATIVALGSIEIGTRRLDAKGIALLACLAALAAAMRLALITGLAGFSPFFFLVLCAGYVFGPSYGFLTGTVAMLVSAIVSGGLGPWLPYQIFAAGWVGLGAGIVSGGLDRRPTRRDFVLLAAYGLVAGFAFGAVMDLWDWAFFQGAPELGYVAGLGTGGDDRPVRPVLPADVGRLRRVPGGRQRADDPGPGTAGPGLARPPAGQVVVQLRVAGDLERDARPDRSAGGEALQAGDRLGQVEPSEAEPDVVAGLAEARAGQEQDAFRLDELGRESIRIPAREPAGQGQLRIGDRAGPRPDPGQDLRVARRPADRGRRGSWR